LLEMNYSDSAFPVHATSHMNMNDSKSHMMGSGPGQYRKIGKKRPRKNHIKMPSTSKGVTEYVTRQRKVSTEATETDTPQVQQYTTRVPVRRRQKSSRKKRVKPFTSGSRIEQTPTKKMNERTATEREVKLNDVIRDGERKPKESNYDQMCKEVLSS